MSKSQILLMFEGIPTWIIVTFFLALMLAANELGYRVVRWQQKKDNEQSRSVSNLFKGSIFGLVALLLGFSFSATTNRYDVRRRVVLDQANAIGTCYLRAGLLADNDRDRIRKTLRNFLEVRLQQSEPHLGEVKGDEFQAESDQRLQELWIAVEDASRRDADKVHKSQIVPSANEVIDLSSTRAWANRSHLPLPVLVLLMGSVLLSCFLLGHSSGQSGRKHVSLWIASNLIFTLILYVVLDFDRPRQGLIRVDLTPLIELKASIES